MIPISSLKEYIFPDSYRFRAAKNISSTLNSKSKEGVGSVYNRAGPYNDGSLAIIEVRSRPVGMFSIQDVTVRSRRNASSLRGIASIALATRREDTEGAWNLRLKVLRLFR